MDLLAVPPITIAVDPFDCSLLVEFLERYHRPTVRRNFTSDFYGNCSFKMGKQTIHTEIDHERSEVLFSTAIYIAQQSNNGKGSSSSSAIVLSPSQQFASKRVAFDQNNSIQDQDQQQQQQEQHQPYDPYRRIQMKNMKDGSVILTMSLPLLMFSRVRINGNTGDRNYDEAIIPQDYFLFFEKHMDTFMLSALGVKHDLQSLASKSGSMRRGRRRNKLQMMTRRASTNCSFRRNPHDSSDKKRPSWHF